jgi:hypothetical protein
MKKLLVATMATGLLVGGAAIAQGAPGPNGHNDYGLCIAWGHVENTPAASHGPFDGFDDSICPSTPGGTRSGK